MSEHYIDVHCHILPGVDDGVQSIDESVKTILGLSRLGIDRFVATPHNQVTEDITPDTGLWSKSLCSVVTALKGDIPTIELAAENKISEDTASLIYTDSSVGYPSYPEPSRYVLVEPDDNNVPMLETISSLFFDTKTFVWAHPERHFNENFETHGIKEWSDINCVFLISLKSLGGYHGQEVFERAVHILKQFYPTHRHKIAVATDVHGMDDVRYVRDGLAVLKSITTCAGVRRLFRETPAKIIGVIL